MALRRRAAEAGGRLRRLAALPLRPAPRRARASRRSHLDSGPAEDARSREYMRNEARFRMVEQADPARFKRLLAAAREARPPALRRLPAARGHHASRQVDATADAEAAPATADEGGVSHGPHAPRTSASTLAPPADAGRLAARPTTSTPSARLEDAGAAAIVMRSLFEEQITREQLATLRHTRRARRVLRRGAHLLPEPRRLRASGPTSTSSTCARVKAAVDGPGHRARSTARRRAAGSSTRALIEQAGADALELNLYRARRPTRTRRGADDRGAHASRWSRAVREAVAHPGGREALALLHRRSPTSRGSSTRPAPTGSCSSTASTSPTSTSRSSRCGRSCTSRARRSCCCACAGSRSSRPQRQGLARRHRRRPHRRSTSSRRSWPAPTRSRWSRRCCKHGPQHLATLAPGARAVAGGARVRTRSRQMQGSMSLGRCPDPAAFERANYMLILQSWRPDDA